MKNHWLDKKIDKEIDAALAEIENAKNEFKDTDFIEENIKPAAWEKALDPFDFDCEEHDRAVVTEILLKYKNRSHWIDEVLSDIGYSPAQNDMFTACGNIGNLTISNCGNWNDNFNITIGQGTWTDVGIPGGDSIKLEEVKISEFGQICSVCNEEMWPMNTATTMCQGDPVCACHSSSCNLDIFYSDNFVQNETLDHLSDKVEKHQDISQYQTMHMPILPGTMSGTVHWDEGWGFVFVVKANGDFDFQRFQISDKGETIIDKPIENDGTLNLYYDEIHSWETSLNCATGVLELHHNRGDAPKIVVSYEYREN